MVSAGVGHFPGVCCDIRNGYCKPARGDLAMSVHSLAAELKKMTQRKLELPNPKERRGALLVIRIPPGAFVGIFGIVILVMFVRSSHFPYLVRSPF